MINGSRALRLHAGISDKQVKLQNCSGRLELLVTLDGSQWHAVPVDEEVIGQIESVFFKYKSSQAQSSKYSIVNKFSDEALIGYMHKFLLENDQMPPYAKIARYFDVADNAIVERVARLEKRGVFERNAVNKIRFKRTNKDTIYNL